MRAVDVHGFGGGFTLGAVQAGWELAGKMSKSVGFGVLNTLANRHLLGQSWESVAVDPSEWAPIDDVQLVFGNPPCSGFSTLSPKAFRGEESSANDCMWELIAYAGMVKPEMVIFESVQQTFRQGLKLMRRLHDRLKEDTGLDYKLYHVLHNNASVGGVSNRKRYFWVASRVPFGVDHGRVTRTGAFTDLDLVPTFGDMLQDLEPLGMTMSDQPYRGVLAHGNNFVLNSSEWARREAHDGTGRVDGHDRLRAPNIERALELMYGTHWDQGENCTTVTRRYYKTHGNLPESWQYLTKKEVDGQIVRLPKAQRLAETDFAMGHNQLSRWYWDKLARVITGGACHLVLHPHLNRTLTQREAARVQGFPDEWKIWPVRHAPDLGPGWGKGVPVQAGRWVARWARESLENKPGPLQGLPVLQAFPALSRKMKFEHRDDEFVIDITNDHSVFSGER